MKRTARVYLNELNPGKATVVKNFICFCHDVMQYYVDLFWQRQDFSGKLADLPTVHLGKNRFSTTTRLCQALAKQAKEIVRSQQKKEKKRKPRLVIPLPSTKLINPKTASGWLLSKTIRMGIRGDGRILNRFQKEGK